MSLSLTKQRVVSRFNSEVQIWDDVHFSAAHDIIQVEVAKRKALGVAFLEQRFVGRKAAILEVGCGTGRNLEELVSRNAQWTGKGVDIAPAMIKLCKGQYETNPRLAFEMLDIESGYLDETFDAVLLLGVVGYLESNAIAFRNIQRMLRPGGFVILTFGKAWTISRLARAAFGRSKRILRLFLSRCRGQEGSSLKSAEANLFRCYRLSEIQRSFPPEWRVVELLNIAFGSGMLGSTSVRLSKALEPLFSRYDPLRLALTSLVVVVSDPTPQRISNG